MENQTKSQGQLPLNTAVLVLADGRAFTAKGAGMVGEAIGEVCFNTSMTGYQEIMTDPSYTGQLVCFTFPHIGNVGTNAQDEETASPEPAARAKGMIVRADITEPSNWRSGQSLNDWLKARSVIAICGIDTRALTNHIRENGMPHGVIAHNPDGIFDLDELQEKARNWAGITGADLATGISTDKTYNWQETAWSWPNGFATSSSEKPHIVVIDYGMKRNIARLLAQQGMAVTIAPACYSAEQILALHPDGIVLSNGPGDPAATAQKSAPVIKALLAADLPIFGICLGHQMLALALGAGTVKMAQGHHGANHPVKDTRTGKVEIVSMNHGFAVDSSSFDENLLQTHVSLFDGSNCGLRLHNRPVFSVQHHPEASPGPQDSFSMFSDFANSVRERLVLQSEQKSA